MATIENSRTKRSLFFKSYSDLTLDDLKENFQMNIGVSPLFRAVPPLAPDDWLAQALKKGARTALISEKARSEFLVAPVLLFIRDLYEGQISLYSGMRFDVEPDKGLKGNCDFIFTKSPPVPFVQAPVMVMVEAKKNDIEEGIPQCAAEMVAAQIFNQRAGEQIPVIYGGVTTGETWQFLQLAETRLLIDEDKYFINNIANILGILKHALSNQVQL